MEAIEVLPLPVPTQRVAYVVESYGSFIGNEIRALRKLGFEVVLLGAFRPMRESDSADEELRLETRYFPESYVEALMVAVREMARRPLAFGRLILRLGCNLAALRMATLAVYFAKSGRMVGVRHLHATYGTRTADLAWAISRWSGIPFSLTIHAYDLWANPSLVWKGRDAAFVRVISAFNARFLHEKYGVDSGKIRVRYLGVDCARIAPTPGGASTGTILSVGRLVGCKGHDVLIEACRLLHAAGRQLRCQIVGDGPVAPLLRQLVTASGLEQHVELLGALSQRDTLEHLRSAGVFVLACTDERSVGGEMDGIPVALMEAMAAGLPVISTALSGIPELIENRQSGMLVPPGDAVALAEAIRELLDERAMGAALAANARRVVEDRFDLYRNTAALGADFASAAAACHTP